MASKRWRLVELLGAIFLAINAWLPHCVMLSNRSFLAHHVFSSPVDTQTPALSVGDLYEAYRSIQPFYLWPQPYCEVVKDTLDFVHFEMRAPGQLFCNAFSGQ